MKILIFFILLCQLFSVSSQGDLEIIPFEDYKQCYTGFRNKAGDTVFNAQFSSVFVKGKVDNQLERIWVVEKDGKSGLLNNKGEYILALTYDSIIAYSRIRNLRFLKKDLLLVYNKGSYGMIDFDGKVVVPINYNWLKLLDHNLLELTSKEDKVGIYNLDSAAFIIPPVYSSIRRDHIRTGRGEEGAFYFQYYVTSIDNKYGVLNLDGTEILEAKYSRFRMIVQNRNCYNPVFWYLVWDGDIVGVLNADREMVLPIEYNEVDLHLELKAPCGKEVIATAITKNGKDYQFHNLNKKSSSLSYQKILRLKNQGVFFNKNKWGVINTECEQVYFSKLDQSPLTRHIEGVSKVLMGPNIKEIEKKYRKRYDFSDADKLALFDFQLNKSTELIYNAFDVRKMNDSIFYWMYNFRHDLHQVSVDIFDENLNVVNHHDVYGFYYEEWKEDLFVDSVIEHLVICEVERNRVGAFNLRGDLIIEPLYNNAIPFPIGGNNLRNTVEVKQYEFHTDSTVSIYSNAGQLLSPINYKVLRPLDDSMIYGKREGGVDFLDLNYNITFGDCDTLFNMYIRNIYFKENIVEKVAEKGLNKTYAGSTEYTIKDNKCYMRFGQEWIAVDSSNIIFKNEIEQFGNLLLSKNGEVVFQNTDEDAYRYIDENYAFLKSNSFFVIDRLGNEIKRIDTVRSCKFERDNNSVEVTFLKYSRKRFDLKTLEWITPIEPLGYAPCSIGRFENLKWVRINDGGRSFWQIQDLDGNVFSSIHFDHKFYIKTGERIIYRSEKKYGVIDDSLNVILKPEYNFINNANGFSFIRKDNKWGYLSGDEKLIEAKYYNLGSKMYPRGRVVFDENQRMGVINHAGEWLIPFCSRVEMIENYGLVDTLYGSRNHHEATIIDQNLIFGKDSLKIFRRINNENIYVVNSISSIRNTFMPRYKGNTLLTSSSPLHGIQKSCQIVPHFVNLSYYSEVKFSSSLKWRNRDHRQTRNVERTNYEIQDGHKMPIRFEDLFKGNDFHEVVDELLMDLFNKYQVFGIACIDQAAVLTKAKENFFLEKEGIVFKEISRSSEVILPYSDLVKILKHPEAFGL